MLIFPDIRLNNHIKNKQGCKPSLTALSLSINPGVVKGRLPLKLYSGSDDMCVRTDENPEVFVPCRFCRPGARARGKTRKNSKKWRSATFLTLSMLQAFAYGPVHKACFL